MWHWVKKKILAYIGASTDLPFWITLRNEARNQANELGVEFIDLTSQHGCSSSKELLR